MSEDLSSQVDYYKELAHLRGEMISALMSGNSGYGAFLLKRIEAITAAGTFPEGRAPSVDQKKNLKDALAKITTAVTNLLNEN